jgi:ankyrin repeat protein
MLTRINSFVFFLCSRYTPLRTAVDEGHVEICRLLLQSNADVEAKDER